MPPKRPAPQPREDDKLPWMEDLEEIRKCLDFLTEEMSKIANQQKKLVELMNDVKEMKLEIKEKDEKIVDLERRVNDMEQHSRLEDIIISGLDIKPRSYSQAANPSRSGGEDASTEDLLSVERQVINFLGSKNIQIDANNIAACHTLPRRNREAKPIVIVRFTSRKHKTALLLQGKKLKGTAVYMNEHLTKKNAEIARDARYLRKLNKIKSTWTWNCKVLIRLNGSSQEEARVLTIRELKDLEQYR